jgi:hypothetical protein
MIKQESGVAGVQELQNGEEFRAARYEFLRPATPDSCLGNS